ncbi:trans-resveratrol di-O-methyltransferase-like [Gossypium australe]|uniref:Trans-resveratrol di-O-methyltransferase-like n=1 Tax=Gossypium australe TaxID=47621 RepID=A0A5B6UV54_9ROSI|nr:trans-resveratrol di-O-methyltransferase-like [Gossypium australe]
MTFPRLSKTFVLGEIIYPEQRMAEKESLEGMLGNLSINAIPEEGIGENLSGICPYIPESVLNIWNAEEIPKIFRTNLESPDINYMSDATTDSESPFEQDMCLEEPQDFEDDQDCNLSPNLLRMSVEIVNLRGEQENKEVKIGACITTETKRDLIELLQELKDVFAWSYQDMPSLSTDVVVHRLPSKE